jgi:hypothetical protein
MSRKPSPSHPWRIRLRREIDGAILGITAPEWFDDADVIDAIREGMAKFEAAKPDTGERPAITLNEVGL